MVYQQCSGPLNTPSNEAMALLTGEGETNRPAPILHRRQFMQRLDCAEADSNPTFCALVISVCAATAATLRRKSYTDYGTITVERCALLINTWKMLKDEGPFTLEWCLAKYNLGTATMAVSSPDDPRIYRMRAEVQAGVTYLVHYRLVDLPLLEQELLKRIYWLLVIWTIGSGISGRPFLGMVSTHEGYAHLRPKVITDHELDGNPKTPADPLQPCRYDDISYIPGLNSLIDIFLVWQHAQQTRLQNLTFEHILTSSLASIQRTIDALPPELRWRGGLSRPAHVTCGHDVQIANIFITSLYMRSNLVQQFGNRSHGAQHHGLVSDLLKVLHHLPQFVLEANGTRLIPKIRDIGAAYLNELKVGSTRVVADPISEVKLKQLIERLDALDYWSDPTMMRLESSVSPLDPDCRHREG
ncbi:hypothetical protein PG987_013738 [Apiospora arundinis]